jgi:predicted SAM-dependent methyltransferase
MKLNIGSGFTRLDGFLNVDGDPLVYPDYLVDFTEDPLPFDDNSVDEIRAHHIFEHLDSCFFDLIKEIYRVCKPEAIIDIEVPYYKHDEFYGDPTHCRPFTLGTFELFSKKHNYEHIKQYNSSNGCGIKFDVDFEIQQYGYLFDSQLKEYVDSLPELERERYIHTHWNVIQRLRVIWKVIKGVDYA